MAAHLHVKKYWGGLGVGEMWSMVENTFCKDYRQRIAGRGGYMEVNGGLENQRTQPI